VPQVAQEATFTAEELLEHAGLLGLRATRRLITDWVELGLLDEPTHRGLGRARGSAPGYWPLVQAELFIDLLTLRQRENEPVVHIAPLANLPVAGWLWQYPDVPLRQVRRALATWCGRHRKRSGIARDNAKRIARLYVEMVQHPHATMKSRNGLRRVVEHSLVTQTFDLGIFRDAVEQVFDPHHESRVAGPAAVPLRVDLFVRLAQARFQALKVLEQLTDQQFEDARLIYLQNRREYPQEQPELATDSQFGRMFKEATFDRILNVACLDLLTILGMGLLAPEGHQQLASQAREKLATA
jgi:hypothetical protein